MKKRVALLALITAAALVAPTQAQPSARPVHTAAEIDRLLNAKPTPTLPTFSEDEIREFLGKESKDFCQVLMGDPEVAKREIQKRIKKLVLTPKQTPNGTVLEAIGDVGLFQSEGVMVDSLMEEIAQHYTGFRIPLASVVLTPSSPLST